MSPKFGSSVLVCKDDHAEVMRELTDEPPCWEPRFSGLEAHGFEAHGWELHIPQALDGQILGEFIPDFNVYPTRDGLFWVFHAPGMNVMQTFTSPEEAKQFGEITYALLKGNHET